jgi:hypothetical protein
MTTDRQAWNAGYNKAKRAGATHREACNAGERAVRAARHTTGQISLDEQPSEELPRRSSQQGANGAPVDWKGY